MATPNNQMLHISECLSLPARLTTEKIVPCLDEESLYALIWTCKDYHNQYKNLHADKKIAAEMLHCVLNPIQSNQEKFLKLLSVPKQHLTGLPLYLIPNNGEENYFNQAKEKKTKTKRQHVSVLEAVLRTGNFHLEETLFNNIPEKEKTETLKKKIAEIRAKGIWGMPELMAAYKNFHDFYEPLSLDEKLAESDRLSRLIGLIGHAQKAHLPWFSLYLFCHPVKHDRADYTLSPNWICELSCNSELDLDVFSVDSTYALNKGNAERASWTGRCWSTRRLDSAAFDRQCKVLSSKLDNTIKQFGLNEPSLADCTSPAP